EWFDHLQARGRAALAELDRPFWIAAERLPELKAIHPDVSLIGTATAPPARAARAWTREGAVVEIIRGRLTVEGPTTAGALAASLSLSEADVLAALVTLETDGVVLRG